MLRTRFAPSPNGPLHLGHAYAAVQAHDLARSLGGEFLLRIEDIDGARSHEAHVAGILADLSWLGLNWDGEVVRQSTRMASYAATGERLKAMGLIYPCQCTRSDVSGGEMGPDGPIYPGTCRGRDENSEVKLGGVAWRLDMHKAINFVGDLVWQDALKGGQKATPQIFGDVVILRKEAPNSYHLAATLDDAADGVTHVTRGQDLFAASHIHRLIQALLDLPVPQWHHHGLLIEADGRKLAKRRGSESLADLRVAGVDGRALADELRQGRFPDGISLASGLREKL